MKSIYDIAKGYLPTSVNKQISNINNELYNPSQQNILKILGYFLIFAIVKDVILWKKPCYKECAEKCQLEYNNKEGR